MLISTNFIYKSYILIEQNFTFGQQKITHLKSFFMKSFFIYCSSIGMMFGLAVSNIQAQEIGVVEVRSVEEVKPAPSLESLVSLTELKQGNERFVKGQAQHINQSLTRLQELTKGQNPKTIIVSCSDSRVPPEIVFDQGLGDIFSIRTAGNVMSDYEEGSIEYAVEHLGTPLLIVMGHQGCGAIQALLDSADKIESGEIEVADHVSKIIEKLKSEEEEQPILHAENKDSNKAVVANVINGVRQLRHSDPVLKEAYQSGKLQILGAVYHIDSGEVEFLDF